MSLSVILGACCVIIMRSSSSALHSLNSHNIPPPPPHQHGARVPQRLLLHHVPRLWPWRCFLLRNELHVLSSSPPFFQLAPLTSASCRRCFKPHPRRCQAGGGGTHIAARGAAAVAAGDAAFRYRFLAIMTPVKVSRCVATRVGTAPARENRRATTQVPEPYQTHLQRRHVTSSLVEPGANLRGCSVI